MWRDWAMATFRFAVGLSVADLMVTIILIWSGVNVPPQLYFAPQISGESFLNAVESYRVMSSSNPINVQVIYFFFYVMPRGLWFALSNLVFGVLGGFPIMVWNIGQLLNAPITDIAAFLALAVVMQTFTWIYFIDALIGWIFIGRTMDSEAGG